MEYIKELTLDLNVMSNSELITAKQGDYNSRKLLITITEDGNDCSALISTMATATVRMTKPDGKVIENTAVITTAQSEYGAGKVLVTFTGQMLLVAGRGSADVVFTDAQGHSISTVDFAIYIYQAPAPASAATSTDEFEALTDALTEAENFVNNFQTRVSNNYIQYSVDGGTTWHNFIAIADLPRGYGITSITSNADYTLTINYGDGSSVTTISLRGATGEKGETGATGATGATGNGISSVYIDPEQTGQHVPGTLDKYYIAFTDGTTTNFSVYNGADGSSSSGMSASVYDPQGKQTDIFQYTDDGLDDKQDTLVSGTNIKTINNTSMLGSGNINIPVITVDSAMSSTSTNPLQNKAIYEVVGNVETALSNINTALGALL